LLNKGAKIEKMALTTKKSESISIFAALMKES
jgi:hypothetical protein